MSEQDKIKEMSIEELEGFRVNLYEELEKVTARKPSTLWHRDSYQMIRFYSQKAKAVASIGQLISKNDLLIRKRVMDGIHGTGKS
jgi:hypothetical protein